jgi:hypothetical protein
VDKRRTLGFKNDAGTCPARPPTAGSRHDQFIRQANFDLCDGLAHESGRISFGSGNEFEEGPVIGEESTPVLARIFDRDRRFHSEAEFENKHRWTHSRPQSLGAYSGRWCV